MDLPINFPSQADVIARLATEDEARGRAVIEEFVARHDRPEPEV